MTPAQLSAAANRINSRLDKARKQFPNSNYVNEMERRIVLMTTGTGVLNIGPAGVRLSRAKSKWAQVPTALAEAIVEEILDVGLLSDVVNRAKQALEAMDVEQNNDNLKAMIEGDFNDAVNENKIWEIAYDMRTQNQALYDLFGEMRGKAMRDWDYDFSDYTDKLREAMLTEPTQDPLPSSYGINQRKTDRSNAARAIGRALGNPATRDDPDTLARLFQQFGQADYGITRDGVFYPADYSQLTPDQIRGILRKFLK